MILHKYTLYLKDMIAYGYTNEAMQIMTRKDEDNMNKKILDCNLYIGT